MSSIIEMCRICLSLLNDDALNIYTPQRDLAEKINRYLYLSVSEDDDLSKKICEECFEKINDIHFFARSAADNQKTLLKLASEQSIDLEEENDHFENSTTVIYVKNETESDSGIKEEGEWNPRDAGDTEKKKRGPKKKPFEWLYCPYCNKQFRWQCKYEIHVRSHTGEKPFVCDLCGKRSTKKEDVASHIEKVHLGVKAFQCELCPKKFVDKASLQAHIFTHTGLRPHQCEVCGDLFTQKANMMRHVMRRHHLDNLPFLCTFCPRKFASRPELKVHVAKHTGMMPYSCLKCGEGFKTRGALKFHNELHIVKYFPERQKIIEQGMVVKKKKKKKKVVVVDEDHIIDTLMKLEA